MGQTGNLTNRSTLQIFYSYVTRYPECIHAINKDGWTALLYAARAGNAALVSVSGIIEEKEEYVC